LLLSLEKLSYGTRSVKEFEVDLRRAAPWGIQALSEWQAAISNLDLPNTCGNLVHQELRKPKFKDDMGRFESFKKTFAGFYISVIKKLMRYFFIEPSLVAGPVVSITGTEAHHIKNVLRLKPGEGLKLFDGTGFEYEAVIVRVSAKDVAVEIQRKLKAAVPPGVRIIVAQAI